MKSFDFIKVFCIFTLQNDKDMKIENVVCKGRTFTDEQIIKGRTIGNELSNSYVYEMECDGERIYLVEYGRIAPQVEFPDQIGCMAFDPYKRDETGMNARDYMIEVVKGVPTVDTYFDAYAESKKLKKKKEKEELNTKKEAPITNEEVENILHGIFQYEFPDEDEKVKITIDKDFIHEMREELERFQDISLYDKFIGYKFVIKHDYGRYDNDFSIVTYRLKMIDTNKKTHKGEIRNSLAGTYHVELEN